MPHIIVKLAAGRDEARKALLSEAIAKALLDVLACDEAAISVAIEDVASADWAEKVYRPDIVESGLKLYKKPGYNPFA
jgi:4-oxalocrotonate tautomerase